MSNTTAMANEAWARHEQAEELLPGSLHPGLPPSSPSGQHTRAVRSHSRDALTHAENRRALEEDLRRLSTGELRSRALESGLRAAKVNQVFEAGAGGAQLVQGGFNLIADQQKEALVALIADHEEFLRIVNTADSTDEPWRKIVKTIRGEQRVYYKKHNQLSASPRNAVVLDTAVQSLLNDDEFEEQLKLAERYDEIRDNRRRRLAGEPTSTAEQPKQVPTQHSKWHMHGHRVSAEELTEFNDTVDTIEKELQTTLELDEQVRMSDADLAKLSTAELENAVKSLVQRVHEQAEDARDDRSREYLKAVAVNLTSVLQQDDGQDSADRKKVLIGEIKMHRETDHSRLSAHAQLYDTYLRDQQTVWVEQQMRLIGAQPAPPGMEHSKKNPRQLRVKKLDATRVVETLLSGEQAMQSIDDRVQHGAAAQGAALGTLQDRKKRLRSLTTWCRLGAMAAVRDSSRPSYEAGAILRIGRIVRFIERKEDLDQLDKIQGKRFRKWSERAVLDPEERYILEKVVDEDNKPRRLKNGDFIYRWQWTHGSPSALLSGDTWLSSTATELQVGKQNLESRTGNRSSKSSPPHIAIKQRLEQALIAAERVKIDWRCVVAADLEDIEYACSEQVENTKRSLVELIIMCHWKLNLVVRLEEPEISEMYENVMKIDEGKRETVREMISTEERAQAIKNAWQSHKALHHDAQVRELDVLSETEQKKLEARMFGLTQEALINRARCVRGWAPGELCQDKQSKRIKLYIRNFLRTGRDGTAWVCPWQTGIVKDGSSVQIRLQASAVQSIKTARWCDPAWWRSAPWRDDEWWEQDNAPRSEYGTLDWHPLGYPREEPLPATAWDTDGAHTVAFAGTLRTLPSTRISPRSGVLVELEYSNLDHDIVDIRDLCDAERLHDGYTLSELNQISKPYFWCKAGQFATYVLNESNVSRNETTVSRTGQVVHVDFREGPSGKGGTDLGSDGRADRRDDLVTIDFGQSRHGKRELRKIKVSFLRAATKQEEDEFIKTQHEVSKSAEMLEFAEAQLAKKDFYNYSMLERKKKGQRWRDTENPALKGLSANHALRFLTRDEDDDSFRERQKVQARTLARLMQANLKLTARVLEYVREDGPNADSTRRAVRNLLVNSPNPLWTCYSLAAHLDAQAYYPVLGKQHGTRDDDTPLQPILGKVDVAQETSSADDMDSDRQLDLEAPTEQEWSREAAKKMVRLATAIANALGIDTDDDRLCAAFLQPKLNPDPVYIKPPAVDADDVLTRALQYFRGLDVEPSGSTDAGPLYEAICAGDTDFVSVEWVKQYVENLSAGSFSLEDEYRVDLPTGLLNGFYGTQLIESERNRMYSWLVRSKVWPRWYFAGVFYCWCGLQVPGSLFLVPNFRYALDTAMYIAFLVAYTWGVVLDLWNVSHLSFIQLSDPNQYDGPFYVRSMRVYSLLYLLGSIERELRQLVRLGPTTYFSDFWNVVEMISPASGAAGLAMLETGDSALGVTVLAFAACLLWLRLLQPLRASHSIGPLIPVMIRMIREVAKFAIVLIIVVMGFAVGMHSILQASSNSPEAYAQAKSALKPWPSEYEDLTTTVKTLARAALGDFSADFGYSDYEQSAIFGLTSYILVMMLMLMNLLITLLMKRYDEVEEKMDKQFAFVRASAVFWLQDAVLDHELSPPFNLLQIFHPDREKVAWLVWLAVAPPVCVLMLFGATIVVGGLYVPYFTYLSIRQKFEGDTVKIRDTNINAPTDEDVEFLMSLEDGTGSKKPATQRRNMKLSSLPEMVVQNLLWAVAKPLLMVTVIAFGVGHWALITICTLISAAIAYFHFMRKCLDYVMQMWSESAAMKAEQAKEEEARQNVKRLCESYAVCIDFLAEKDWDKADSRGQSWTNNSETGVLDRLLADEFKSEEQLEMEEAKQAKLLACEGVELARRRKLHAAFIQKLWTRAKTTAEIEARKDSEKRQQMANAESDAAGRQAEDSETLELQAHENRKALQDSEKELQKAFELFDKDGNGFISRDELAMVLKSIDTGADQESIVSAMMMEADMNGDGQIQYSEFTKAIVQGEMHCRDETEDFLRSKQV